jgi:hypothetical protein
MVQVSVTASVKAAGGPTVPLGTTLEPESYTYASVDLDAAGGTAPEREVPLLPDDGGVLLLALTARTRGGARAGAPATVSVTLRRDETVGTPSTVDGALLIANADILKALLPSDGPRALTVRNVGTDPAVVEIFACLSAPDAAPE